MKRITFGFVMALLTIAGTLPAQTVVNREWVSLGGLPDPDAVSLNCFNTAGEVINVSSQIVTGQSSNIVVTKYDAGGSVIWQSSYNGTSNGRDFATGIKTDLNNNVYVVGATYDTASGYDFVTLKFADDGVQEWASIYNSPGDSIDIPVAVALDSAGNVYVAGNGFQPGSLTDFVLLKYSNSGEWQWGNTYDYASGYEAAVGLSVSQDAASIVITGASASNQSSLNWDIAAVTYDSLGALIDTARVVSPGIGQDEPTAICRDNSGNFYIAGTSFNSSNNTYDVSVCKMGPDLSVEWVRTYDNGGQFERASSIDVDGSGNVYLAGRVGDPVNGYNALVLKYDDGGALQWDNVVYNPTTTFTDDNGTQIRVDESGNAFVTGSYTQNGNKSFISLKYAANGGINWMVVLNGGANGAGSSSIDIGSDPMDSGEEIAVSGSGTNNTVIKYSAITIDRNNIDSFAVDSTQIRFLNNEILVRFRPELVNPDFVNDVHVQFRPLSRVLPDSVITEIGTALGYGDPNNLVLVKVFKSRTIWDSLSIARNGDTVVLDKHWAVFRLLLPATLNTFNASLALDSMNKIIIYAELNLIFEPASTPNDPLLSYQGGVFTNIAYPNASIHAEDAWDVETGKRFVRVGVVDANVQYSHEDFKNSTGSETRIVGEDFKNTVPINNATNWLDGHGTAAAGIIAANRN